ncbi:acyl-coenzyme A thioesterase 2, chloroplastic-like [Telopea speciosissima]|uniref:acyl-coenzyme A thioesterase 2, chloroplastic-like n=1 Tax=Telopea speciosissima TaxID=54955 RepID=UPI001CC3B7E3|nr:acyl-coenzyme A thioesterase 2, chloroplastic-like [Telopea speciosissima]
MPFRFLSNASAMKLFSRTCPPRLQHLIKSFSTTPSTYFAITAPISLLNADLITTYSPLKPQNRNTFYALTQSRAFSSSSISPSKEPLESMDSNSSPSRTIPVVSTFANPFDTSTSIDASSSIRKPISLWPGMYHSPVTNALWEARSSIFERLIDPPLDAPTQSELLTKTPSQSRTSVLYNFSTDYILREQYRDPWNEVRIGKLLEDLDALAGTISVKHCSNDDNMTRPVLLVTASVDKMVLKKPICVDKDLKIVGAVIWVGRSSIEIQLEVTQSTEESSDPSDAVALTANFTFVARDYKTGKSSPVNQISPETDKERMLWEEADARNKHRKRKRENKRGVENGDVNRLESLLAEGRVFCDMPALANRDSILIRDTCLENSLICQPQQRNIHGRIFGGFLMNRAFELAFSTAYAFAGAAPCFLEVDHVDFLRPVDVGNFLRLKSCVLYTELGNPQSPLINIEVVAHVTRPELRSSEVSNTFYFTFSIRPEAMKDGLKIRNVVPATEEEALRILERIDAENLDSECSSTFRRGSTG